MSEIPNVDERTAGLINKMDATPVPATKRGVSVVKPAIPPDLNSYPAARREDADEVMFQLERLLKFYVGEEAYAQIARKANGLNNKVMPYFRTNLWMAMENWDFDAVGATEKRTKKDDDSSDPTQRQLIELLGHSVWAKLCRMADERRVTNLDALRVGVQHCINKGVL